MDLLHFDGTPLDESQLRKRFARVLKKAGLPHFRVYDLRHTFAARLLNRGVPITYVAAQLGHMKPTTTYRVVSKRTRRVQRMQGIATARAPSYSPALRTGTCPNCNEG